MMNRLATCSGCGGLVPPRASACPNCGSRVSRNNVANRLLAAAGAGAISITLMACYGAPAHYYDRQAAPAAVCPADKPDADGDGVCAAGDCNDADQTIAPGATDAEGDGIDQNCDGTDGVNPNPETPASVRADPTE